MKFGIWGVVLNKKYIIEALFEGSLHSVILTCVVLFVARTCSLSITLSQYIIFALLTAGISVIVYLLLVYKKDNKVIMLFSIISSCSFVISTALAMALFITIPIDFWAGDVNNANGILLLLVVSLFVFTSTIFKVFIIVICVIKNIFKSKDRGQSKDRGR